MLAKTIRMPESRVFCPNPFAKARVSPAWMSNISDRARFERLAREIKELTILYHAGLAVGAGFTLKEVHWMLYQESSRLVNTSNFALAIYDDYTDTLAFPLVFDQDKRVNSFSIKLSNNPGLTGHVFITQAPLLIGDLLETDSTVETDPICPDQPIRSWLGVPILNPMLTYEKPQGVILVWSYQPNAFTDHDLWLLSAIGAQAAIAIENARLRGSVLVERDRVIEATEAARKELARGLHDGPTQLVSAIMMRLDYCKLVLEKDPSKLAEEIIATQELAKRAMHEIRTLLFELRPLALETQGLEAALHILLERRQKDVAESTELTLKIKTPHPSGAISRQDDNVEAAIFAIVKETVNNALKHAQASHIMVELSETPVGLYVIIADDGKGFDVDKVMSNYEQQGSLGMVNIWEQADLVGGELTLESTPGYGTRIIIYVPKAKKERMKKRGTAGRLCRPFNMLSKGSP
jgi:signal transduction histidine kinase